MRMITADPATNQPPVPTPRSFSLQKSSEQSFCGRVHSPARRVCLVPHVSGTMLAHSSCSLLPVHLPSGELGSASRKSIQRQASFHWRAHPTVIISHSPLTSGYILYYYSSYLILYITLFLWVNAACLHIKLYFLFFEDDIIGSHQVKFYPFLKH